MKRIMTISALVVACLMATGCKEEQCEPYAPQGEEISWTEYNSMSDVCDYFTCHMKTWEMHVGDTFKAIGYIPPYTHSERPYNFDSDVHRNDVCITIGEKSDVPHNKQRCINVHGDTVLMSGFRNYQWGQKIYFTAIVRYWEDDTWCCCYMGCDMVEYRVE